MAEPWRKGVVIKIVNETAATRRFWIQIPELDVFNFLPGQFVTLDLPIHEKLNKRWRSYSIASTPDYSNIIELVIVFLEGGAGTTYLFNNIKEGSELSIRGPQGVFTLPKEIDKNLFFICTGTGVAPFKSMIHYIKNHSIPHKAIYLVFGTRTIKDALYYNELKELEKELDEYYYLPVFSRESPENKELRAGYVHAVYEDIIKAKKQPAQFYLCGWKDMLTEAKERILQLGYDKKDIHVEVYG